MAVFGYMPRERVRVGHGVCLLLTQPQLGVSSRPFYHGPRGGRYIVTNAGHKRYTPRPLETSMAAADADAACMVRDIGLVIASCTSPPPFPVLYLLQLLLFAFTATSPPICVLTSTTITY
jgi:hypothetical protein